jgi:hypothetical protein
MDDIQILDVWGAGRGDPAARPLLMLAAVHPELPAAELAELPVGRGNVLLLADRRARFGDRLDGDVACPECGERLEVTVPLPELITVPAAVDTEGRTGVGTVRVGDVEVRFRSPAHADLLAASVAADPTAAAGVLLARCVLAASRHGEPVAVADLPADVVGALDAALAEHDPHADLRLATVCAACGHAFDLAVDPCGLYWAELAEHARRLLVDVHRLATAYGWSEREILRIDPARRAAYLELVG